MKEWRKYETGAWCYRQTSIKDKSFSTCLWSMLANNFIPKPFSQRSKNQGSGDSRGKGSWKTIVVEKTKEKSNNLAIAFCAAKLWAASCEHRKNIGKMFTDTQKSNKYRDSINPGGSAWSFSQTLQVNNKKFLNRNCPDLLIPIQWKSLSKILEKSKIYEQSLQ